MNAEQLAALTVLTFGREELAQKARPVKTISGEYRELAARMIALMDEHSGVGLAAPQIGILERMFVVRFEAAAHVFINPSIIATSHEQIKMEEGCLSLPGIWADVVRPKSITVQAWNER
ncbi:MAG: peptide deformylase, partial [Spirochaetaceae bacterium]|nr:peptide deformylase [Spirochaetaceae bacterium]